MLSPYLRLPSSVDALDRQLDAKFRSNLRRRARKLGSEIGPLSLELVDRGSHTLVDGALAEGFALEAAGWKGERGTAIACDDSLSTRYRALAKAFAHEHGLALYFLRAGDRRIAFHYALVDDRAYYLFKPGFDPALATYGLGHLLVDMVARDLIRRGVRELDFLGDDMPWKREWTGLARQHHFHYVFATSWRARAVHAFKFGLAPFLKHTRAQLDWTARERR
jgi:CelD/BcsL family acetyltransferase involved in cellulose biosynthesis